MLQRNWLKAGFVILAAAGLAVAHLSDADMKPTAGVSLIPGATYEVTWKVTVVHNGTNVDLSLNGGETWTTIKENFKEALGTNKFNWTVAGTPTQKAIIRICQHGSTSSPGCRVSDVTNSLSATTPAKDGNYILIGPKFTITSTSSVGQTAATQGAFSLDFNPAIHNVNVSFALAESGPVLLQAFDARGSLMVTLVEGDYAAGDHKLSLVSKGLTANGGSLVFKLKAGDRVQSHIWTSAR